eukprot:scaffold4.g4702.t1
MRSMFFADGEGLELEEVDAIARPLSDLLDVMQLDTGLLVSKKLPTVVAASVTKATKAGGGLMSRLGSRAGGASAEKAPRSGGKGDRR